MDVRDAAETARRPRGNPAARYPDGGGESHLGLHPDPRCSEDCRAPRGTLDDCANPEGARPATGSGATDLLADVFARALGRDCGADFFTTEVWTWRGLVTYYTVFVIDLASRRVEIVGVHAASE